MKRRRLLTARWPTRLVLNNRRIPNMATDIAPILTRCAANIRTANERFGKQFVEWIRIVGAELKKAQEELAKDGSHDSEFGEWVEANTPFARSRAYQIIDAHSVVLLLSTMVDRMPSNERQCRELTVVPEDELADVWQKILDRGENITAKLICEETAEYRDPRIEKSMPDQWNTMRERIRGWVRQWGPGAAIEYLHDLLEELEGIEPTE